MFHETSPILSPRPRRQSAVVGVSEFPGLGAARGFAVGGCDLAQGVVENSAGRRSLGEPGTESSWVSTDGVGRASGVGSESEIGACPGSKE